MVVNRQIIRGDLPDGVQVGLGRLLHSTYDHGADSLGNAVLVARHLVQHASAMASRRTVDLFGVDGCAANLTKEPAHPLRDIVALGELLS